MKLIMENWRKFVEEVDTKATTLPPMPKLRPPKDITDFEIGSNESRLKLLDRLQDLLNLKKLAAQAAVGGDFKFYPDVLDKNGNETPTAKEDFPDDESIKKAIAVVGSGSMHDHELIKKVIADFGSGSMIFKEDNLEEKRKKKKQQKGSKRARKSAKRKKKKKQDACYHKVKSRYKVWPSAYASGALVRCRKVGAKNWGNKSKKNEEIELDEKKKSWSKSERNKRAKKCANPKGFTMKQFCKNQNSKSKKGEKKNESFDVNERCQKGYKTHPTRKTKIMFGKKYRNCVKAEEGKDPKTGTGKKPKGSGRRLYTDENPKDTVRVKFRTVSDIRDTFSKASFKNKSHKRQSQIINLVHQRSRAAYKNAKDPKVKARLKKAYDYAKKRKKASKRKTQRMKND